jgi:hypothetical protein
MVCNVRGDFGLSANFFKHKCGGKIPALQVLPGGKKKDPRLEAVGQTNLAGLEGLASIITDGFNGAAFFGFFAKCLLFGGLGLFLDVREPAIVIAGEVSGGGLTAKIAIDALIVDVVLSEGVISVTVRNISHIVL